MVPTTSTVPRSWKFFERADNPAPIQLFLPRDYEIVRSVFMHRFLTPSLIHRIVGGSSRGLETRCRRLWLHRYLERPKGLRPTTILDREIVNSLGKAGAKLIERYNPKIHISHLDWAETPKKQIKIHSIDHELSVATFIIGLQLACDRAGLTLLWDGYFQRRRYRVQASGHKEGLLPDAYFRLKIPESSVPSNRTEASHFLEIERGGKNLKRVREKAQHYFDFWKDLKYGRRTADFRSFRVLFVGVDAAHCESLRRAARPIGHSVGYDQTWRGLFFSHLDAFNLDDPEGILGPIWRYADEDTPVSLLPASVGISPSP